MQNYTTLGWYFLAFVSTSVAVSGFSGVLRKSSPILNLLRQPSSTATHTTTSEPGLLEKIGRRVRVYKLAANIYLHYKHTERKEKRLRRQLGILEEDEDDRISALWEKVHERNAVLLTRRIKHLSGFWVKVGQYLSSRADVMPPVYLSTLASLQDSMPARPYEDVRQTLEEELTSEEMSMLKFIDPTPLSTASLAQVHRATLINGRQVVAKVQHRGVSSLMHQDMENLRTIVDIIAFFDPDVDFGPVIREYNKEVQKELDFRIEAQNMDDVRQLLGECEIRATVPKAVPGLVKERVLVMDFCEGFSVRDIEQLDKHQVDRGLLLSRICAAWAAQMHVGGVFNADPHAGNLLVSTKEADGDPSVSILLDFGLTKRLEPAMKLAFARLMHASDETDVDALLQSFEEMGLKLNRQDPFEDMAAMQRSFGETVPQSEAKQVQKENKEQRQRRTEAIREDEGVPKGKKLRNPVDAWPAELILFGRVTAMLKGLCSRLDVRYPYLHTMASAARLTIRDAVPIDERAVGDVHSSADLIDTPLQRRLLEAVKQLKEDDQMVGLQVCVISEGTEVANIASGTLGTANPRPVTPRTLFCMFSVSKAILSIGMLRLLQEGQIRLDDPVAKYWPAFAANGKEGITVRHILAHQAGLANAIPHDASIDLLLNWERMKNAMEHAIPAHEPGDKTQYHYLTFAWLCGGIIEAVTGQPYDRMLMDNIIVPLNVHEELYMGGIPDEVANEALAVLSVAKRTQETRPRTTRGNGEEGKRVLAKYRGREHLLNPSIFNMRRVREAKLPSASGHGSAAALAAVFNSMISFESEPQLLLQHILENAMERQVPSKHSSSTSEALLDDSNASFGLGFQLHDFVLSSGQRARSVGHAGLGGSIVLAIPEAKLTVAVVTNLLSWKSEARKRLLDVVFDEFGLEPPESIRG